MSKKIQVLAFMKPYCCAYSGEIIFYSPEAMLIQKEGENGIKFTRGVFEDLEKPLDQEKINDVAFIFEEHAAANTAVSREDLEEHPFCSANLVNSNGRTNQFVYLSDNTSKPQSLQDVWLRHFLVSMRITLNNLWNLDGQFSLLPNIAWLPKRKMVLADHINEHMWNEGDSSYSVDKFPKLTDWWVPSGVRIADTQRVRLGAHIGKGVTVMHEGFLNFNAAVMGPGMIEGRVSAGVTIGADSDLGGGCSTMGTLSGGGKEIISVGESCLIGAEAGIGISLGDNCTVEAGLYITAGMKVFVPEESEVLMKAKIFSGQDNLLFRRNSMNGRVEVISKVNENELNSELHSNN